MVAPLVAAQGGGADARVLVGPETADDAGVFLQGDRALIATADFITPVCDDPFRYGRVAAANSLSDVYAMGGEVLFALNLCCFVPAAKGLPDHFLTDILRGAADAVREAGGVLLGGHTVEDDELKFGLAVVGEGDPERILANTNASPGERLLLTKPLGTGVLINGFKLGKLKEKAFEPALAEMERLNAVACRLALEHGVRAATDVTGFGLAGHALNIARGSNVGLRVRLDDLPVHDGFRRLQKKRVSTGSTQANRANARAFVHTSRKLVPRDSEILYDPQTSGGLLLCVPADQASALLTALTDSGHRAAEIGEVVDGPPRFEVI
jgi:selenide, water dikinase